MVAAIRDPHLLPSGLLWHARCSSPSFCILLLWLRGAHIAAFVVYAASVKLRSLTECTFAVMSKAALQQISPFTFATLRVAIAVPCLWALARLLEPGGCPRHTRAIAAYAFLGFTGVYLPQGLIFVGVKMVGPDVVAIMQPTVPVFVAIISAAIGAERLSALKAVGIALAVGGAVVMLDPLHLHVESAQTAGILLLVLQCVSYAVFIITLARVLKHEPRPFTVFAAASSFGCLFLGATAGLDLFRIDVSTTPRSVWLVLVYCALVVSLGAHGSISWAVQHVSATVPSLFACLQPFCTTVLAAVTYGDQLAVHDAAGMAMIVPGMLATVWAKRREDALVAEAAVTDGGRKGIELQERESVDAHGSGVFEIAAGHESPVVLEIAHSQGSCSSSSMEQAPAEDATLLGRPDDEW